MMELLWISGGALVAVMVGLLISSFCAGRFPDHEKWDGIVLVLLGSAAGILCAWAFFVGVILPKEKFPWFIWPFIVQAVFVLVLAVLGGVRSSLRRPLFWRVFVLFGFLFLPAWFALDKWPGGDDDVDLAWFFLVAGPALLGMALTPVCALLVLIGHLIHRKRDAVVGR